MSDNPFLVSVILGIGLESMISVYLDTANWIELAEGRCEAQRFERRVLSQHLVPVLSFVHLLEFVNAGAQVIEYMDTMRAKISFRWTKNLHAVVGAEAQAEYERFAQIQPTRATVFGNSLLDVLPYEFGWEDRADIKNSSIEQATTIIAKSNAYGRFQKFKARMPHDQNLMRTLRGTRKRFTKDEKVKWILADLPKTIRTQAGISHKPEITPAFLKAVDPSRCIASSFRFAYFEGEFMSTQSKGSDFEDFYHLVGPAYCDVAFVDAVTHEKLRKGKAVPLPHRNGEFHSWLKRS